MQNDERNTKAEEQGPAPIHHSSFIIHRFEEAEACFLKAIDIARRQQAKSLELRAVMSLSRLWQEQGKKRVRYKRLARGQGAAKSDCIKLIHSDCHPERSEGSRR